jgi:hypothetical protein
MERCRTTEGREREHSMDPSGEREVAVIWTCDQSKVGEKGKKLMQGRREQSLGPFNWSDLIFVTTGKGEQKA